MNIVAFFPLGAGVLAAGYALRFGLQGWRAQHWPMVPGLVLSTRRIPPNGSEGRRPSFQVLYEYSVGGQRFQSASVCPGGRIYSSITRWIDEAMDKYPAGARVQVRYNPANPQIAYLELWPRSFWLLAFCALILGLIGLIIALTIVE